MGLLGIDFAKSNERGELVFKAVGADAETLAEIAASSELSATFVAVEGAPADGDAIIWDDVAGQWVPAAVAGGSSLTVLSEAEGDAGVATTARAISAERLKQQIEQHAPAGGGTIAAMIVATGTEARLDADVVVWIDPDELGATNALATDPVIVPGSEGPAGPEGTQGEQGPAGADGLGVPAGGTTGQVLTKASGADNDTEWADSAGGGGSVIYGHDFLRPFSGYAITTPRIKNPGWTQTLTTNNRLWLAPIYLREAGVLDQLSVHVYAGAGTAVIRVGVYASDTQWRPTGTPIAETTIAAGTGITGHIHGAISASVNGLMHLGAVIQGGAADMFVMAHDSPFGPLGLDPGYLLNGDDTGIVIPNAYYVDSVSGALPDLTAATRHPATRIARIAGRFA